MRDRSGRYHLSKKFYGESEMSRGNMRKITNVRMLSEIDTDLLALIKSVFLIEKY